MVLDRVADSRERPAQAHCFTITKNEIFMTNEELKSHIKAIAEWGKDGNRTVFVVCAEFTKDGIMMDTGISGSPIRIPYALYKATEQSDTIKNIVGAAGEAVKSPVGAALLQMVAVDDPLGRFSDNDKTDKPEDGFTKGSGLFTDLFKDWFGKK